MGASADFLGSLEVFRRRYPRLRWVAWRGVVLGFRLDSLAGAISGLTLPGVVGRSPRCHALREGPKAPSLCRLRRAWRRWCRLRRVGLGRAPVPPRRCGGGFFAGRGPRRRDMGGCEEDAKAGDGKSSGGLSCRRHPPVRGPHRRWWCSRGCISDSNVWVLRRKSSLKLKWFYFFGELVLFYINELIFYHNIILRALSKVLIFVGILL